MRRAPLAGSRATTLSGRPHRLSILPWLVQPGQCEPARHGAARRRQRGHQAIAQVEAGVLASIIGCDGRWCRVSSAAFAATSSRAKLWGTAGEDRGDLALASHPARWRQTETSSIDGIFACAGMTQLSLAICRTSRTTTSMWEILRCWRRQAGRRRGSSLPGISTSCAFGLDEEVVVVGGVGIEVGALSADGDLAQQPGTLELVQGVVDGCQRHPLAGPHGSSCSSSAVTCRSPLPNRSTASATRWRVGRRPAPPQQLSGTSTPHRCRSSQPDCPSSLASGTEIERAKRLTTFIVTATRALIGCSADRSQRRRPVALTLSVKRQNTGF